MDQNNKVDMYIMTNEKYFPAEKIMYIKEKLEDGTWTIRYDLPLWSLRILPPCC